MSALLSYEPLVDNIIREMINRLETEFDSEENKGKVCDIGDWLQYCRCQLLN